MRKNNWLKKYWPEFLLTIFYFAIHLWQLVYLPVFADEAIYIRWSQLIIDDWRRYLFFPLNDGKTPLWIWWQVPFLKLFNDPLWAARFLAVIIGWIEMLAIGYWLKILGLGKKWQKLAMLLTAILPFFYFHHRLALMEALLVLLLTLTLLGYQKLFFNFYQRPSVWWREKWLYLAAAFFTLALWTKIPAILFLPSIVLTWFFAYVKRRRQFWLSLLALLVSLFLAFLGFLLLKINPAFGQLFARGGDFLYPIGQILAGDWRLTIKNIPTYGHYLLTYLTWPIVVSAFAGLFNKKKFLLSWQLFLSGLSFFLPIALLGKVVYPRYFFPISLFFLLMAVLSWQDWQDRFWQDKVHWGKRLLTTLLFVFMLGNTAVLSSRFIYFINRDFNLAPLVSADQEQYLTTWSAGFGIRQATDFIQRQARQGGAAAATEGYFGTLPDGILMYLHNQDVSNIYVEGIGQPVRQIPASFQQRSQQFERQFLIVNANRLQLSLPKGNLLQEYCRPLNAPCLQIWKIK